MKKNLLDRVKSLFAEEDVYTDVKTDDNRVLRVYSDVIAVDVRVEEVTSDGLMSLEDADYLLDDGRVLVVKDGMISEIKEAEPTTTDVAPAEGMSAVLKFAVVKQISKWEMIVDNDTFEVGSTVKMTCEDGEEYTLYNGTYELEDGRLITLNKEGVIVLITDSEGTVLETPNVGETLIPEPIVEPSTTDVAPAEDAVSMSEVEEAMSVIVSKFEKTIKELEEKYEKLASSPSAQHTNVKIDFKSEDDDKPVSYLHSIIKSKK